LLKASDCFCRKGTLGTRHCRSVELVPQICLCWGLISIIHDWGTAGVVMLITWRHRLQINLQADTNFYGRPGYISTSLGTCTITPPPPTWRILAHCNANSKPQACLVLHGSGAVHRTNYVILVPP
jgi:hypothetical protein